LRCSERAAGLALAAVALLAASSAALLAGPVATPAMPATIAAEAEPPPEHAGPEPVLELELGPRAGAVNETILRVFLNTPRADATTPPTEPGYVGSLSLLDGGGGAGQQRFALPLSGPLARLAERSGADPLLAAPTVTIVAVPIREGTASGAAVEIAAASLVWR
jgi:hypothetical protein